MALRGWSWEAAIGPAGLGDRPLLEALEAAIPDEAVEATIDATGTRERRRRLLPTHLVVTLIDPTFHCDGTATASGLDAISFGFAARLAGVNAGYIIGRAGQHLEHLVGGGEGTAELTAVDDRFVDADGGAIDVARGGMVAGLVKWKNGDVKVEGVFAAPHCAALDFAAAM